MLAPTGVPQFEQNFSDPTGLPQLEQTVDRTLVSPEKTFSDCIAVRIWSISTAARVASISVASFGASLTQSWRCSFQQVSSTQLWQRGHCLKSGMISLAAFLSASSRAPRSVTSRAVPATWLACPKTPPRRLVAPESSVPAVPSAERWNSLL